MPPDPPCTSPPSGSYLLPRCRHLTFLPAPSLARSLYSLRCLSWNPPPFPPSLDPLSLSDSRPPSRRSKVLHFVVIPLALNIYRTFPSHAVAATCGRTVREIPPAVDTPPVGPERRLLWGLHHRSSWKVSISLCRSLLHSLCLSFFLSLSSRVAVVTPSSSRSGVVRACMHPSPSHSGVSPSSFPLSHPPSYLYP